MSQADLLIVGAGPAGMAAASRARAFGLSVTVIDDQPNPGGQIWRSIEVTQRRDEILGPSYIEGRDVARAFRESGADYRAGAQLWQVDLGFKAFVSTGGRAETIRCAALLFATGAQERPVPFSGWTLPGVVTVGAAQILLKNAGQIPSGSVWIAGSGPLPLLYVTQLLRAGGKLAGYLDTTPPGQWRHALPHLPRALWASGDLVKGVGWLAKLRTSGLTFVRGANGLEAQGVERLAQIRFKTRRGDYRTAAADSLLVHEGVVPNIHSALSLGCSTSWDAAQESFRPDLDEWGETSVPNAFIAGDAAGIAGARAAGVRGELAAIRIATKLGKVEPDVAAKLGHDAQRRLRREVSSRAFLDALYRPREEIFSPPDETIVCRCEEVTAGTVRRLAATGQPGVNQIKAATRMGMGPCQGRQCGYSLTRLLARVQGRSPADIGFLPIRPPLKPVTLGEIATLNRADEP